MLIYLTRRTHDVNFNGFYILYIYIYVKTHFVFNTLFNFDKHVVLCRDKGIVACVLKQTLSSPILAYNSQFCAFLEGIETSPDGGCFADNEKIEHAEAKVRCYILSISIENR